MAVLGDGHEWSDIMTGPTALLNNRTGRLIGRVAVVPGPARATASQPGGSPSTGPAAVRPTSSSAPTAPPTHRPPTRFAWTVTIPVIVVGMFLSGLNSKHRQLRPAGHGQAELDASTVDIQWVKTSYYLALAVAVVGSRIAETGSGCAGST